MIDVREALMAAYVAGLTAPGMDGLRVEGGTKTNLGQIAHMVEAAHIMAEIDKLRPELRAWVALAYGPLPSKGEFIAVASNIAAEWESRHGQAMEVEKAERVRRLLPFAVVDTIDRVNGREGAGITITDLAYRIGAHKQNWQRDGWDREWTRACAIPARWDVEAVEPIERRLLKLKRGVCGRPVMQSVA